MMAQQLEGISGIPGVSETFNAFIQTVRLFTRDHPQLNRLVKGEESSDRMIAWAIHDFLSDFAGTPPNLGFFSLEDLFERYYQSFALRGTTVALLESVGILQTRNQLSFSDGGISVGVSDKSPMLLQWISQFRNKYEQEKIQKKVSMNIENAMGSMAGAPSEYTFLGGWFGTWM
jgi:hypothetical protein